MKRQTGTLRGLAALALAAIPVPAGSASEEVPTFTNVTVHDPSVVRVGADFYVFGSHLASARTRDGQRWTQVTTDTTAAQGNALVPDPQVQFQEALAWVGSNTFWAPDVIQLDDGRFYFYYCVGRLDAPIAALGVAVSDSVTGPYTEPRRDAAVRHVRPAQPRRHELRPTVHPEHRRSRRLLRPGREAVDGVRLVFGRHLHPGARSRHRLPAAEPGLREEADRRQPQPDRRRVHPLQPRSPTTTTCSSRSAGSTRTAATTSASAGRAIRTVRTSTRPGNELTNVSGRARHAVRRRVDRALRREADGQLAVPSRRRRAGGDDHGLSLAGPQLRLLRPEDAASTSSSSTRASSDAARSTRSACTSST